MTPAFISSKKYKKNLSYSISNLNKNKWLNPKIKLKVRHLDCEIGVFPTIATKCAFF